MNTKPVIDELAEANHLEHCSCSDGKCIPCQLLREVEQMGDGLEILLGIEAARIAALEATLANIRGLVTSRHESLGEFIVRVRIALG